MNIKNIGFQYKDLLLYLRDRIQYLEATAERWLALKEVYRDYKQFMTTRVQSPLLYRQFRQDFQEILKVLPKKDTQIFQKKNTWMISNVAITNEDEMLALYQNFYNISAKD